MALNSNLSIIHKYFSELDKICSLWTQDWRLWYSSTIQSDVTLHCSNVFVELENQHGRLSWYYRMVY